MMALVQKDYKRLLSYHAISQVGYMILGIGTALPVGIVGGLFHMINHAHVQELPVPHGGSVEKQAGTTDLAKLGGLARKMPVTFACFIVAALSISGCPPFNGFFSKELVYDGALEARHVDLLLGGAAGHVPHGGLVPQAGPRGLLRQAATRPTTRSARRRSPCWCR